MEKLKAKCGAKGFTKERRQLLFLIKAKLDQKIIYEGKF
jgi:hypothetical protein